MNTSYQHNIPDDEREAFERALTIYFSGKGRIRDAFARVERGLIDRYYRRRKEYPNEILAIMRKARAAARTEYDGAALHLEARQLRMSIQVQLDAVKALTEALPELISIATGETRVVQVTDENGERYEKTVPVYPRDMIAATRLLQGIARGGVLLQGAGSRLFAANSTPQEERVNSLDMLLPVRTDFSTVTATTPDGQRITTRVERDGNVVGTDDE